MKIFYTLLAWLAIGACHSPTEAPKQESQQQATADGVVKDDYMIVRLSERLAGRFAKGEYIVYSDSVERYMGHNVPTIKSLQPVSFSTILTSIKPEKCIGKRVEYTALVRAKDIKGWAGLWLRIDPKDPYHDRMLGFDNMHARPIKGTSDWTKYHIVLDVPEGAANLVYGILLDGDGQVWIDSMDIKIVDNSVPTTEAIGQPTL